MPDGYIGLSHSTQYSLKLTNDSEARCDVELHIDGKHVGTWRVGYKSSVLIERPVHDTGRFTFYRANTLEASKADISVTTQSGLIKAVFKPERDEYESATELVSRLQAGATGLSGFSDQEFKSVEPLDYDSSAFVTINLRLVCIDSEPRPLFPRSNAVPPPVE